MDSREQGETGGQPGETQRVREQTLPVGYRLHEYVISKVIGSGGFGVTYLGRDTNLDKAVAIKEYFPFSLASRYDDQWVAPNTSIQQDQSEYEWGLSQFIDEARTLAKFEHPNLIRVVRYIEENGTAYIVMDFAEGKPLSAVVNEEGLLSEERLKSILLPLLDGLSLVHASDMLHRDVKPDNIIIRLDGSPVLIDFGAARQAISSRSQPISTILTPGYAPYEQYFASGNQGPWTDIYALGAVTYACLTGKPPDEAVQRAVEDSTTPLTTAAKGRASRPFLEAIDWAIRPREADRPQSATEWKDALTGNKTATAVTPATQRMDAGSVAPGQSALKQKKSGIPTFQMVAIAAILIIGGVGGYFAWESTQSSGGFVNREPPAPTKSVTETSTPPKPVARTMPSAPQTPPSQTRPTAPSRQTPPQEQPSRAPAQPQRSRSEIAKDNATFETAQFINTPEAYRLYLRLHPNGLHVDQARRRTN